MFCGDDTMVGAGADDLCLRPLLCKRWTCETCLPKRLNQLKALAAAGGPTTLITLTCRPSRYNDPSDAGPDLVRLWRNVRQRLTRDGTAPKVPFIAVMEATKRGWPHLHILCRAPFISQKWLSAAADALIGAPIVDIRAVYNRRHAARYIAKYVSKGPARFPGCKRYWRSQDYAPGHTTHAPIKDANRSWRREREHHDYLAWTLQKCGWDLSKSSENLILLTPGQDARWLWPDFHPPPTMEVRPWQPLMLE